MTPVVQLPHWPTWIWAVAAALLLIFLYHVSVGVRVKGGRT